MFFYFPILKLHLHQSVHPIVQGKKQNPGSFTIQSVNWINFLPNLVTKYLDSKFRSIRGNERTMNKQSVRFIDRYKVCIPVNNFQHRNR